MINNEKEILVTGGAGYIGHHVVGMLLDKGYKVRVLDSLLFGSKGIEAYEKNEHFSLIKGDIRHIKDLVDAIKGVHGIIHLGAIVGDPACSINYDATWTVNQESTKSLMEIACHYQVMRLVFASSCSVYGASKDLILNEGSLLQPISHYARTRIESERIILDRADNHMVPTIARLGTIYGYSERMRFDLVVNILTAKATMEGKMTVFHPEAWRPFVHVQDAARAFIALLEAPPEKVSGEIFNVGSNDQNYQIKDLGELTLQVIPDAILETAESDEDLRNYRVSFDKIQCALGFNTNFTVKDGISEIRQKLLDNVIQGYKNEIYYNVRYKEYR
ncbi:NAD-dependent epimerase/dehydratase family protein [Thermodesulfobacteriota bacterium]